MKSLPSRFFLRLLFLLSGITILGFVGALFILSGLGGDSVTIFNQGVSRTFGIDVGLAIFLFNFVLFLVLIFVNRKKIGLGTFVMAFAIGPLTSLFLQIPFPFSGFWWQLTQSVVGTVIGGFALGLYVYADVGLSAVEGLMLFVHDRFHIPLRFIKMAVDAVLIAIGYLLGGVVGVGTIIALILMGPIFDFFLQFLKHRLGPHL